MADPQKYSPNAPYQQPPGYQQAVSGQPGYQANPYQYQQAVPTPQYGATHTSNNVVVVGQPVPTQTVYVTPGPRAPDYLVLSIVLTALCLFCGVWLTLVCLIPAVVFSAIASSHNSSGDYESARSYGRAALGCNITALMSGILTLIIVGIILGLLFAGVIGCVNGADCYYNGYETICTCY